MGFREIRQSLQNGKPALCGRQSELAHLAFWGVLIACTLLWCWRRECPPHAQVIHTASYAIVL